MHRVNVSLPDEDWKLVKRHCLKIRPYQPVGTTIREILLQAVTPCNTALQAVPCPDPARAPERQQDRQTDSKSIENGPAKALAAVADAIRDSEWYGATLPKAHTPETYAALLLRLHPQMTPAHVYDASLWLENNPGRRKKYLGGFLTNWMRNDGKFAAATKSQQSLPATSAQRGLGDDEGYENGTW